MPIMFAVLFIRFGSKLYYTISEDQYISCDITKMQSPTLDTFFHPNFRHTHAHTYIHTHNKINKPINKRNNLNSKAYFYYSSLNGKIKFKNGFRGLFN